MCVYVTHVHHKGAHLHQKLERIKHGCFWYAERVYFICDPCRMEKQFCFNRKLSLYIEYRDYFNVVNITGEK